MNDVPDVECERRLGMIRRAIRRTLYTNASLSRRCHEARQRLNKMRFERFVLAKRVYGAEILNPRKAKNTEIEIRNPGGSEDLNGFLSFRKFASLDVPNQACWYRCLVAGNIFTIVFHGNEGDIAFSGVSPIEAHEKFIAKLNEKSGVMLQVIPADQGAAFFGLNHPSVHVPAIYHQWLKLESCLASHPSFSYDEFISLSNPGSSLLKEEPKPNLM